LQAPWASNAGMHEDRPWATSHWSRTGAPRPDLCADPSPSRALSSDGSFGTRGSPRSGWRRDVGPASQAPDMDTGVHNDEIAHRSSLFSPAALSTAFNLPAGRSRPRFPDNDQLGARPHFGHFAGWQARQKALPQEVQGPCAAGLTRCRASSQTSRGRSQV